MTGITSSSRVDAAGNLAKLRHTTADGAVAGEYLQRHGAWGRVRIKTSVTDRSVRRVGDVDPDVTEVFDCDLAGRLTRVDQHGTIFRETADHCRIRQWGFNNRSARVSTRNSVGTVIGGDPLATCRIDDPEVTTRTFNAVSQPLPTVSTATPAAVGRHRAATGDDQYRYDAWGRTTYLPCGDSPTATPTAMSYYVDDNLAATATAQPVTAPDGTPSTLDPGKTITWQLRTYRRDPEGRISAWTTTSTTTSGHPDLPAAAAAAVTTATRTNLAASPDYTQHFPGPGDDAPGWAQESPSGWSDGDMILAPRPANRARFVAC